jgi:flagellar basal-body rod protein FlgF
MGMMNRGLYVAASGMIAQQARQDQLANDLANAATPGYRPDRSAQHAFGELLVRNVRGAQVGAMSAGVRLEEQTTDMRPAPLRVTDEPLDFAIDGDGYFAVQTADGVRYTRNGQFALDPQGRLVTAQGDAVLDGSGRPIAAVDGKVDPRRLGVVMLTNPAKAGDSLVTGTPAGAATGTVRSGALESSGADAARSMVDMIASMRAYEAGQKVIQAIDDTLGQAAAKIATTQ